MMIGFIINELWTSNNRKELMLSEEWEGKEFQITEAAVGGVAMTND